ncbi:MAG: RagB/SusD family nutrient uptake outer membrane protein [Chitinophagaceae bacterium]|nr:RagB/SusD family nutrient uptake outer membrane protein [Chitinophagaceae bacterium]
MKQLQIKLTGVLLLAMVFVSCNKWVDYNPKDDFKITDQEYLRSEADYRAMAVGAYAPLQWLNQLVPVGDMITDNSVSGGESASDVFSLQQIDDFSHGPINFTLSDLWQSSYEGINRVNYLGQYRDKNLQGETISFPGKDALYGELSFLRAYYYFTLVKMYGGVPLFVEKRLTLAESGSIPRSSKEDVYSQIETDLTNAIAALPVTQVEQGRATKYAAQALLGKVYLYQKKYDAAASMLENVIGKFSLVTNFSSIFLPSGENGPESVFEIQYSNGSATYDWAHQTRGQGNYSVQQCGVRGLNGSAAMPYSSGWSTNLPTQNLAAAYEAGDQRKAGTVLDIEAYKTGNPALNVTYQVAPYKNTGLYNQKYLPRKGETSGQIELNYSNNFRTIRYADVLLMAAEANNKATAANDIKAQNYLNQVRRRAFGNNAHDILTTGATLYDAILNERRLELAMEGERFFDLVRTGKAATVLAPLGFVAGKHELFPIP